MAMSPSVCHAAVRVKLPATVLFRVTGLYTQLQHDSFDRGWANRYLHYETTHGLHGVM